MDSKNDFTQDDYEFIESRIDYQFKNRHLLLQAFVRKSYSVENDCESNEVLEFIGNDVLGFIITKILTAELCCRQSDSADFDISKQYDELISDETENGFTQYKKKFVERKWLAKRVDKLGLNRYLILGKGDRINNVHQMDSVKEDLFEAILGAVAVDSGWDIEKLETVVRKMTDIDSAYLSGFDKSYTELFQAWYHKEFGKSPEYKFYNGTRKKHSPYSNFVMITPGGFTAEIQVFGKIYSESGPTKSRARSKLAEKIYLDLEDNNLLITIRDDLRIDELTLDNAINKLQELYQKGECSKPEYVERESYGNMLCWECRCTVFKYNRAPPNGKQGFNMLFPQIYREEYCGIGKATSKKVAKKKSAYNVLRKIFPES